MFSAIAKLPCPAQIGDDRGDLVFRQMENRARLERIDGETLDIGRPIAVPGVNPDDRQFGERAKPLQRRSAQETADLHHQLDAVLLDDLDDQLPAAAKFAASATSAIERQEKRLHLAIDEFRPGIIAPQRVQPVEDAGGRRRRGRRGFGRALNSGFVLSQAKSLQTAERRDSSAVVVTSGLRCKDTRFFCCSTISATSSRLR